MGRHANAGVTMHGAGSISPRPGDPRKIATALEDVSRTWGGSAAEVKATVPREAPHAGGIEEERRESAEEAAHRQAWRPPATTTKDDELLFQREVLGDDRPHATGTTHLRGRDGQLEQNEQEVPHARVSVEQTARATQRCSIRESGENCQFETHRSLTHW
jgi:hypothetical protein